MVSRDLMNRWMFSLGGLLPAAAAVAIATPAAAQTPVCSSDLDGDGEISGGDLSYLLVSFGSCPGSGAACAEDLDQDGDVNAGDISVMLLGFGACQGPSWATVLEWAPDPAVVYDSNLRSDIAATHMPWRVRDNGTGIEMVLIPPGSFMMGCEVPNPYGCNSDASPIHAVTLTQAFYLGRHEVTQAQWTARMGSNPSYFSATQGYSGSDARPVERVSWDDIQPFCTASGLRLPTEAEWEYAYRAGTSTIFHGWFANPGGSDSDGEVWIIAWHSTNTDWEGSPTWGTKQVGKKAANGFGIHDMAGNVWELVRDWFGGYPSTDQIDPPGPSNGSYHVLRGGSWFGSVSHCRASLRSDCTHDNRAIHAGFRVARTP